MTRILSRHETLLAGALLVLALGLGLSAPAFFGLDHLFSIARSLIVVGIMALGLLTVLISGGIDVSVSATAVSSMYVTVVTLQSIGYEGSVVPAFLIAAGVGTVLGLVNGALVSLFHLPTLIVTLGTLTLYRGALLSFVGTDRIGTLPGELRGFARANVMDVTTSTGGRAGLHLGVLLFLGLAVALALALRYTRWGRWVYAVGGDEDAAARHGVPVTRVRLTVFALAGALAGVAGLADAGLIRAADPFTIVGSELNVLAAVVLGGASIAGGRGTVVGTVLGVTLITLVDSSLLLVGIPSVWQKVFVGVFLLAGVAVPAIRRGRLRRHAIVLETT